ncbi:MAG: enoyl-CoA hydratase/isomerase family protein [Acidimicrobiia bacterium]
MPGITVTDEAGVAVVRITRPPANAMDPALVAEGVRVAADLRAAEPDAVILTGQDRFFSGGLDLNVIPNLTATEQRDMVHAVNAVFADWYGFPRPLVVALNGHAVAGGLILALCGDLRFGVANAKLGLTEVKVGVPYPVAAIEIAKAEVPPRLVRRLVLGGELIEPPEAHAAGILDELVVDDALLGRALDAARVLASHPRRVYETVKRQLRGVTLDRIAAAVATDPLADAWLGEDTADAAAATLRER